MSLLIIKVEDVCKEEKKMLLQYHHYEEKIKINSKLFNYSKVL